MTMVPRDATALTRRSFLSLLGVAGVGLLLLGGGCAHTATPVPAASPAPPPRTWDDSEILRAGRWAG